MSGQSELHFCIRKHVVYNDSLAGGIVSGRKESTMKRYNIVKYAGGAVYEPAEGGYYVPVLFVDAISTEKYKMPHAQREFRKIVAEISDRYGKPTYLTKTSATWTTGNYVGDEIAVYIESESAVGRHAVHYYGYC